MLIYVFEGLKKTNQDNFAFENKKNSFNVFFAENTVSSNLVCIRSSIQSQSGDRSTQGRANTGGTLSEISSPSESDHKVEKAAT